MPTVDYLINQLNIIKTTLNKTVKSEKSLRKEGKNEVDKQFEDLYDKYLSIQTVHNSADGLVCDHAELSVVLAEVAYEVANFPVARGVLENLLQNYLQRDQYYCRAKVLMGLVIKYESRFCNGNENIRTNKLAISEIISALSVATQNQNIGRYKFIIFNISVAFWNVVHQFLRPNRAKSFHSEISLVVNALENIQDPDIDWRIMYLSAASYCADDNQDVKLATEYIDKAIDLLSSNIQICSTKEEGLSNDFKIRQQESDKILTAFHLIEERQSILSKPPKIDPDLTDDELLARHQQMIQNLPPLTGLSAEGFDVVKQSLEEAKAKKSVAEKKLRSCSYDKQELLDRMARLYMQRIAVNNADAKYFSATPIVANNLRFNTLVQLQSLTSQTMQMKESETTLHQMIKKLEESPASNQRTETLLDVSRFAWSLKIMEPASKSFLATQNDKNASEVIRVKADICEALRSLNEDYYNQQPNEKGGIRLTAKQADGFRVNIKIEAIKLLSRSLTAAMTSLKDYVLAQEICVYIWNASITLLQPHSALKIYSAIKNVAVSLEQMSSPLTQLRTQIQFELAKCEEMNDLIVLARDESLKAFYCDYGFIHDNKVSYLEVESQIFELTRLDSNRPMDIFLKPYVDGLVRKADVYSENRDDESKIFQLLLLKPRQSKSKTAIEDCISKAFLLIESDKKDHPSTQGVVPLPLQDVEDIILTQRTVVTTSNDAVPSTNIAQNKKKAPTDPTPAITPTVSMSDTKPYTVFTYLLYKRLLSLQQIAQLAVAVRYPTLLQQAACQILSTVWDPQNPHILPLLHMQIEMYFLLATSFVEQLSKMNNPWNEEEDLDDFDDELSLSDEDALDPNKQQHLASVMEKRKIERMDPRSLGLKSDKATPDMIKLKNLVLLSLDRGIQLASLVKDVYGMQNGITYFWNSHIHIFRNGLYPMLTDNVIDFLKNAIGYYDKMESFSANIINASMDVNRDNLIDVVDQRVKLAVMEALAQSYESSNQLSTAIEVISKVNITKCAEYHKRKCCELWSKLLIASFNAGAAAAPSAKGGKVNNPSSSDPPNMESAILLNVYALLAQAEHASTSREQKITKTNRIVGMMTNEVSSKLQQLPWKDMTQETLSQWIEMQSECWTRITFLRIICDDVLGAQFAAEKCLNLISLEALSRDELKTLNPRVWRWMSVCESLYAKAIRRIINTEGQELSLQFEIRLVCMVHNATATEHGVKAGLDELIIEAAIEGWNVSLPINDDVEYQPRLYSLQRRVIDSLKQCNRGNKQVTALQQQYYLAMIEGWANTLNWDECLKVLNEAFEHVTSSTLQKPLWQWRVVILSKKGKNVLDGIQKLKESDPSLQAKVFIVLARSSNSPKQQLESYLKAIEILAGDLEQVDYILETAQWMGSSGVPRDNIKELLLTATDALYEVEEHSMADEIAAMDDALDPSDYMSQVDATGKGKSGTFEKSSVMSKQLSRAGSNSVRKTPSVVSRRTGKETRSVQGDKRSTRAGAVNGRSTANEEEPPKPLNFKQLEQTYRSLIMLAVIESDPDLRMERCIEAVYFIGKSIRLWFTTLQGVHKKQQYHALSEEQRTATSFEDFSLIITNESMPTFIQLPNLDESLSLIAWNPHHDLVVFHQLSQLALISNPLDIPSEKSLSEFPLTIHYLWKLSDMFWEAGFAKSALFVLSFVRMQLMTIYPLVKHYESAVVANYYKMVFILSSIGLETEVSTIPTVITSVTSDPAEKSKTSTAISDHSIAAYVKNFIKNVSSKRSSTVDSNGNDLEIILNENGKLQATKYNPFGFHSWTYDISGMGGFDRNYCMLSCCESLLRLGELEIVQLLNTVIQSEYIKQIRSGADPSKEFSIRSLLESTTIQSKVFLANADFDKIISNYLKFRELFASVGDATLLYEYTRLAVTAYLRTNQLTIAKEISFQMMGLIEDVCNIEVMKTSNNETSTVTLSGKSTLITTSKLKSKQKEMMSQIPKFERSLENITAFTNCVFCYIDSLLMEAESQMSDHNDPRPTYFLICDTLGRCRDFIGDLVGENSRLYALINQKRCFSVGSLLQRLHKYVSARVVPIETYASWLNENLLACLENGENAMKIFKNLLQNMPNSEIFHQSKLTGLSDALAIPATVLNLPVVTTFVHTLYELSEFMITLAIAQGLNATHSDFTPKRFMNPAEQYLEGTKPENQFDKQHFETPILAKAAQLASSSSSWIVDEDGKLKAKLLFLTSNLMRLCHEGQLDAAWSPAFNVSPLDGSEVGNASTQVVVDPNTASVTRSNTAINIRLTSIPAELKALREELVESCRTALNQDSFPASMIIKGCLGLVEGFGRNSPFNASMWLMQMQSMEAKRWLEVIWMLNTSVSSEVGKSMSHIQYFEAESIQTFSESKRILTEKQFLKRSSMSYRRLSVSTDPIQIVTGSASKYAYLCIQFCPLGETLYIGAGPKKPLTVTIGTPSNNASTPNVKNQSNPTSVAAAVPTNTISFNAGQTHPEDEYWMFDKIKFTEEKRRSLQVLLIQHKAWLADVNKFVALYGETTSAEFDLQGAIHQPESAGLKKVERSLSERFAALINDMELLVQDGLGQFSKCYRFLTELTDKEADAPVVLLLDPMIQSLPWEGLAIVNDACKGRTCRDFSIHMLHQRLQSTAVGKGTTSTTKTVVTGASMKVLVDPLQEDAGSTIEGYQRDGMIKMTDELKQRVVGGGKWSMLQEKRGAIALQDWLQSMDQDNRKKDTAITGTSLFVYCLGRLGSLLNPNDISSMNCEKVNLLFVMDKTHNDVSYRRQNSSDVQKSIHDIDLESWLNMSVMLSLSGVNSLVNNHWSVPFCAQTRFSFMFWQLYTGVSGSKSLNLVSCHAESMKNNCSGMKISLPESCYSRMTGGAIHSRRLSSMTNASSSGSVPSTPQNPSRRPSSIKPSTLQVTDITNTPSDLPIKNWIKCSRVVWGIPDVIYNE